MPSIVETFVTVMPETSRFSEGIRRGFREADPVVREAAQRWGREIEQGIGNPKVELKADTAKAKAEIDEAARDRHSTIHVDVDKDRLGQAGTQAGAQLSQSMASSLSSMGPQLGGAAASAGSSIGSSMGNPISAALMAAGVAGVAGIASSLSGLAGLLPAGLVGAGGLVATLAVGLNGVKDGYDAVTKAAKTAGDDQVAKSREVAAAQRGLTDAVQGQERASRDVATAWRDARQQLDDLNLSLGRGQISEAQAYNDVLKARRDLARGGFKDSLEANDAQLRVLSAEQSWKEAKERNIQLQGRATEANAQGVAGSDLVVNATERQRKANEQVVAAQERVNEAQSKTSSAAKDAADALAKLSPAGAAVVQTFMGLKPQFQQFKNSIQDALLGGIAPQIQQLATTYMPVLQGLMTNLAGTMNRAFGELSKFLMQPQTLAAINEIFRNIGSSFQVWVSALKPAGEAFFKFTQVGSGFLPQLAQIGVQVANMFNQFAQSGQLQQWMQTGMDALGQLVNMLPTVMQMFGDLAPIGTAALGAISTLLTAMEPAIKPMADLFASALRELTPWWGMLMQVASTIIGSLAPAFTTVFNAMAPFVQQIAETFAPVLRTLQPILQQVAGVIGQALVTAVNDLMPVVIPLVQSMARWYETMLPLLPDLFRLGASLLPIITDALKTILPSLTTFITSMTRVAEVVMPAVKVGIELATGAFNILRDVVKGVWDSIGWIFEKIEGFINRLPEPLRKMAGLIGLGGDPDGDGYRGGGGSFGPPGTAPRGLPTAPSTPASDGGPGLGAAADMPGGNPFATPAGADWDKVAGAEASGNWAANTGNGFFGGMQFTQSTWDAYKPEGAPARADQATKSQQIAAAEKVLAAQGANAWPKTSADHPDWFNKSPGWFPAGATPPTPAPAPTSAAAAPPPTYMPAAASGLAPGDAALLASVPAGRYTQSERGDLTQGLADCSSAVEDLVNIMQGKPTAGASMYTGNADQWLTSRGFLPTNQMVPGALNVGFNDHHMQATLPGGTPFNWGSDDAAQKRGIGGTGAFDPSFTSHYYLPSSGVPSMGMTADNPMHVALPDAQVSKMSPAQQLGQDFVGGIAQVFGFDGSLFKNPMDSGLFKLFKGVMGLGSGGGGGGAAMPAGGGGGGVLGGLLGGIVPNAFGPLKSGSPGDAPSEFMPAMPGSGGGNINLPAIAAGPPGAAGPGNANDYSINFNGPVGNPMAATDAANSLNVPRMRQGMRPLPQ